MPENWKLANAAITDMQMRQRDVAALDAKYTKELADAKAKNDALRDDVAAASVAHQQSVSQCVKPPPPPAWIMQPPRLADTAERMPLYPQREADHYAKTTEEPRSILTSSADRVAHIDGQLTVITSINSPAEYKCLK